jgi:CRISP-associated protein Cas1
MVKRTIEISKAGSEPGRFGVHLAARNNQLLILVKTDPPRPMPASPPNLLKGGSIPIEDVGVVMVDQRDATYTHHALVSLANAGAAVVLCGEDHLPAAMVTPISTSTELQSRLDVQIRISEPTRKRIWQSIIEAKIRAQARTLTDPLVRSKLEHLADRVRSGDPENREGQAAVAYWPSLFQTSKSIHVPFRRVAGAGQTPLSSDETQTPILLSKPPNNLLDYGYAVLRAAVVRAITSAGLLPALGIQHRSRANPFCLADDLMEPLRPMIDARVRLLCLQATHASELTLNQDQKAEILKVLAEPVLFPSSVRQGDWDRSPLMVAIQRMVTLFIRVLEAGEAKAAEMLEFPILPHWAAKPAQSPDSDPNTASTPTDSDE